jgi:glycerol-3-phosphate dehydrogenase
LSQYLSEKIKYVKILKLRAKVLMEISQKHLNPKYIVQKVHCESLNLEKNLTEAKIKIFYSPRYVL